MEIELVRGTRRRKHVEAELVGDRLRVSFPRWMSLADAQEAAEELAERMRRRIDPARIDVAARARRLAREYGLPRPEDACSGRRTSASAGDRARRTTRRSASRRRLAAFPSWVLDYVLVHELAHLLVEHHGPAHDELVNRFPLAERARGFLIAKDLDPDDLDECDEPPLLAGDVRP